MNFEHFIARKLNKRQGKSISKPIVVVAVVSITLSLSVMLISNSVLVGFQQQIKEKIIGFSAHIRVKPLISEQNKDEKITLTQNELIRLKKINNINNIQPFVIREGVIKTKDNFEAIVLKGVENNYDWTFFRHYLKAGMINDTLSSKQIVISSEIANKLNLNLNDKINIYFQFGETYKIKRFEICAVFQTGLMDYDKRFILCSNAVLQDIAGFGKNDFSGYEIVLNDYSLLNKTATEIYKQLPYSQQIETIEETEPSLFSWLDLLNSNVLVILVIMLILSIVTISSTLLIIIFENTSNIGVLKGMGVKNESIRRIFLYNAGYIIFRGIIIGNLISLILMFVQKFFHIFSLPQESYFLNSVPISLNFWHIFVINIIVIVVGLLSVFIPLRRISKISPAKSIRFS